MARRTIVVAPVLVLLVAGIAAFSTSRGSNRLVAADEMGAFGFRPGERVHDFEFEDVGGKAGSLEGLLANHDALVIALRTTECPVSQKYGHRLARLEKRFGERDVAFAFLDVSPQDTEEKIRDDIAVFGFEGTYILDSEGELGALLQAKVSTEIFVIDASRTLRYRGAVDDQFGITFSNPVVRNEYLVDALEDVLAGRKVRVAETDASGCHLREEMEHAMVPERDITYHSRVSRIVQENCVVCHRDGGVAPMALDTYQQVYGFRHMIKWVVNEGRMPPWFANPQHGQWANDRRLSERNKRDLFAWIEAGAPEGDRALATEPRKWVSGWQLDEDPDAVIQIADPIDVPAEGVVDYQYVFVKTDFDEDKWIEKIEPRPTAAQVTHHIIVYLQGPDDKGPGAFLGGQAPGMPATVYPEGTGKRLPKGAWLMFELHYTPNGRATRDQSMVGMVFADSEPEREVRTSAVARGDFEIPPHADNHEVVAEQPFRRPGKILALLPHMHLRGKAFRYELVRQDGTEQIVLDVPRYDFNWQLWYEFQQPLRVEAGDILRGRAWYDNSENNPANPDPTITVRYGEQSFEEMMFGFFDWVPAQATPARTGG